MVDTQYGGVLPPSTIVSTVSMAIRVSHSTSPTINDEMKNLVTEEILEIFVTLKVL